MINKFKRLIAIAIKKLRPAWALKPLSYHYGFDRGTPIDRYWIESFLKKNKKYIKGRVLEITDNYYTLKFGAGRVNKSDVLDIDKSNPKAKIYGDLRNLTGVIEDNTYDCIILTHVLGLIDEFDLAIAECRRILKKGGTILVTSSCFSPTFDRVASYWRFTPTGLAYAFSKHFGQRNVTVDSYGNVLTGQGFWVGMAREEFEQKVLSYNDPDFACISALRATKQR